MNIEVTYKTSYKGGKAARGEVPPGEPYQYYLDKLEEEGGVNVQQDLLGRLHAGR